MPNKFKVLPRHGSWLCTYSPCPPIQSFQAAQHIPLRRGSYSIRLYQQLPNTKKHKGKTQRTQGNIEKHRERQGNTQCPSIKNVQGIGFNAQYASGASAHRETDSFPSGGTRRRPNVTYVALSASALRSSSARRSSASRASSSAALR